MSLIVLAIFVTVVILSVTVVASLLLSLNKCDSQEDDVECL
jgi:hypothetical protein